MSRCTEHTRRKLNPNVVCCACKRVLLPGERYRQLILIQEEFTDKDFERSVAHSACVAGYEEWELWEDPPPWVKPPLGDLTEEQQHIILHSLGMGSHIDQRHHGYRNGYAARPGDARLRELVEMGLMVAGRVINQGRGEVQYFHVTHKGAAAVGRPDLGVDVKVPA